MQDCQARKWILRAMNDICGFAKRQSPGGQAGPLAAWAAGLAPALALGVALFAAPSEVMPPRFTPIPFRSRLYQAAVAVLPSGRELRRPRSVTIQVGAGKIKVPISPHFDRATAIALALELDAMRIQAERLTAGSAAGADGYEVRASTVNGLTRRARERLDEFLVLDPQRSRVVLGALGWAGADGPITVPGLPVETLGEMAYEASSNRDPWPVVSRRLAERYGLDGNQLQSLRAYLCRLRVQWAFESLTDLQGAAEALQRYAALVPAQVRTVLAMAGAIELAEGKASALPVLMDMMEQRPDLAHPLLVECVHRCRIEERARRAARQLTGPGNEAAREVLLGLGPFGAEALALAVERRPAEERETALRLLEAIRSKWPGGGPALETLGTDAWKWRRWFGDARKVLSDAGGP